jgi:hypothetical protein
MPDALDETFDFSLVGGEELVTIRTHSYRAILSATLLNPAITHAKEGTNSHSSHASFQKGHKVVPSVHK